MIAYHFTTKSAADHILEQGFIPSEDLFGIPVVWLTRNPDDLAARRRGPVRLTVTIDADHWLVVIRGMIGSRRRRRAKTQEDWWRAMGKRADETLDEFIRRYGCAGLWYTSDPWLAVLDPRVEICLLSATELLT